MEINTTGKNNCLDLISWSFRTWKVSFNSPHHKINSSTRKVMPLLSWYFTMISTLLKISLQELNPQSFLINWRVKWLHRNGMMCYIEVNIIRQSSYFWGMGEMLKWYLFRHIVVSLLQLAYPVCSSLALIWFGSVWSKDQKPFPILLMVFAESEVPLRFQQELWILQLCQVQEKMNDEPCCVTGLHISWVCSVKGKYISYFLETELKVFS